MRKIKLISKKLSFNGASLEFNYQDQLMQIAQSPMGQAGITMVQIMTMVPILTKIKEANGSLILEDSEHQEIMDRLKVYPFAFVHEDIAEFILAVQNAETMNVN